MDESTLVQRALTHSSWAHENGGEDNERLEFLGDAVLQLCVSELLYRRAVEDEADMTFRRQKLVNNTILAQLARDEGVDRRVRTGRSMRKDEVKMLAGTWEALLGALFLEQGYEAARAYVAERVIPRLPKGEATRDPVSRLHEHSQQTRNGQVPRYVDLLTEGPDHDRTYTVGVWLGDGLVGEGAGRNKKAARKAAAIDALRRLGLDD